MGEGLLADDAVGLERSAALEGNHARAELGIEHIGVLVPNRGAVEVAEPLPHPLHVLAARAGCNDGPRAERRSLPEDDERPPPVAIDLAEREGVAPAPKSRVAV